LRTFDFIVIILFCIFPLLHPIYHFLAVIIPLVLDTLLRSCFLVTITN
jgi:hypothetical protein